MATGGGGNVSSGAVTFWKHGELAVFMKIAGQSIQQNIFSLSKCFLVYSHVLRYLIILISKCMCRRDKVLIALRQIIRATELYSRKLSRVANLTTSQLLIMQTIASRGRVSMGDLADELSISQATVTSVLDRLERRNLILRERDSGDKRRVYTTLTEEGRVLVEHAPSALQDNFVSRFEKLKEWEQLLIISSLQRVAVMMNADGIDAAPVLDLGAIDRVPQGEDSAGVEAGGDAVAVPTFE